MRVALCVVLCASCSFVAVKGPQTRGTEVRCTDSALIPSIDAFTGAVLAGGAVVGEIIDRAGSHKITNYELIIGLPALVVGITYLVAASKGTDRVSTCQAVKRGEKLRGCDGCPAEIP